MPLWPSGIDSRLGRNWLWVRFLAVLDIYPMFIEPTITWVPSGFSGYIWLDTKIVLKKMIETAKKHVYCVSKYVVVILIRSKLKEDQEKVIYMDFAHVTWNSLKSPWLFSTVTEHGTELFAIKSRVATHRTVVDLDTFTLNVDTIFNCSGPFCDCVTWENKIASNENNLVQFLETT